MILSISLVLFFLAYRYYSRFICRLFEVDDSLPTPAHSKFDGVDFIPAKNWSLKSVREASGRGMLRCM